MLRFPVINQKGFTLLEMTLALGIFVVLFTLTLGVYSYAIKAEQRTIQVSKLQREAQFIMEIIAKKIRSGKIDYSFYANSINADGESELALLDSGGNQTVFKFGDNNIKVCIVDCDDTNNFFDIPPADVQVASLKFFITPLVSPFVGINEPPDEFPKVTVVIDLENTRAGSTRNLVVQQTIPQRLSGF
jgi:prepilin-type N-terminal cleavage/methylation domain-containing protein